MFRKKTTPTRLWLTSHTRGSERNRLNPAGVVKELCRPAPEVAPNEPPIRVLLENRLPAGAAIHDIINCAGILHADFAGHESARADAPLPIDSKTVYSAGLALYAGE